MAGASATATAAACANRFDEPMTKLSKLYFGLSRDSGRPLVPGASIWLGTNGASMYCRGAALCSTGCCTGSAYSGTWLGTTGSTRGSEAHVRVDRDREVGDRVVTDAGDGLGDRDADALLEHPAGQVVRDLEVEGAGEDALRFDQVEEAVQLRGDAVVLGEEAQDGGPEVLDGVGRHRHVALVSWSAVGGRLLSDGPGRGRARRAGGRVRAAPSSVLVTVAPGGDPQGCPQSCPRRPGRGRGGDSPVAPRNGPIDHTTVKGRSVSYRTHVFPNVDDDRAQVGGGAPAPHRLTTTPLSRTVNQLTAAIRSRPSCCSASSSGCRHT